jgi:hypothetical protein
MKTPKQSDKTKTEINLNFNEMSHATLRIPTIPLNNESDDSHKSDGKLSRGRQLDKKIICKSAKCCNGKLLIIRFEIYPK